MPQAPLQRDHRRRLTPQDRPHVPSADDIYGMARSMLCGCYEDCQDPDAAAIEIGGLTDFAGRWPYRWAFDFASTNVNYYAFAAGLNVELVWNGTDGWDSELMTDGPCPGGSGGETPEYQWQLRWLSDSLNARQWTLSLVRNGGTGTCDEWVDLIYENRDTFDPLCPNEMIPKERGLVAPYSEGLSCRICLAPAITLVEITCLGETMSVPEVLGVDPDGTTFETDCADPADMIGGIIPFTHDTGCIWTWTSSTAIAFSAPCDDATITWTGQIEIEDAGGGDVKPVLTMTYNITSTGSAGCTCFDAPTTDPDCTQTFVMDGDTMPIADVAAYLAAGFQVSDVVGGAPGDCYDPFLNVLAVYAL